METHRFTVMPFLLAFMAGLVCLQPTNVFVICRRGVGILDVTPYLRKRASDALSAIASPLGWFARLWRLRVPFACAAVLLALLVADLAAAHPVVEGVATLQAVTLMAGTRRTNLESELKEATRKAKDVMTVAEKENRELNEEERKNIQAHLDEGKRLKLAIERIDGDDEMRKQIEALGGGKERPAFKPGDARSDEKGLTLGQQLVRSEAYEGIKQGRHTQGHYTASLEIAAATLTEDAASGGDLVQPQVRPGILPILTRRILITDLVAPGTTDSNTVEYLEETTFTNSAAARAEAAAAAESTLIFDRKSTSVRSIAHFLPATNEMLEDVGQAQSYIDGRLRLGLALAHEDQLLNGTGVAPNLQGIYTHASLHAAQARGADTNADAIFKQIMAIMKDAFVMPDGVVLHPDNWQTIVLAKDGNGQYYGAGPFGAMQVPVVWGLPAAVTPVIPTTNALVGAFAMCSQRFTRRGATVTLSNSHSDYFVKRLVAILAEMREALAIYRPGAFGKVTGLN